MNFLGDIYKNSLHENEQNINFWEDYLQNLNSLDFSVYSDKLTVPILVPIGNRILFRGELKHTNEVTVALGADYFAKCSIKQAEILRQHRIKDTQSKLQTYNKEKEYLESQLSFGSENVYENSGKDIIEVCSEEEDKRWREQHKERVRKYHQSEEKKQEIATKEVTDEELWLKLEELELQEELENELASMDVKTDLNDDATEYDSLIINTDDVNNEQPSDQTSDIKKEPIIRHNIPKQISKVNVLQQVIDRQKMLEEKLTDLKYRERAQSKTEQDLLNRLDEIDQLDEMEDEIDRLDDIIYENIEENNNENSNVTETKRSVAFLDEDDSETLEIRFRHSNIEPCSEQFDNEKGITKPSDIYKAYSNLFSNEAVSILRKPKYSDVSTDKIKDKHEEKLHDLLFDNKNKQVIDTIVVKDILEKKDNNEKIVQDEKRPTSLFKKRRQQQKSSY